MEEEKNAKDMLLADALETAIEAHKTIIALKRLCAMLGLSVFALMICLLIK